ncbi:MAG: FeoB-associated Cys-rich membrane protein [Oscillospiraceae bacterium]|nr:FeoB-associated Cys-rich membrane protein [Oscillospiraceae bacterium]MBS6372865.1 FeoB-associated Cys-rich membrane protein [Oscillospiraceae bacterium]
MGTWIVALCVVGAAGLAVRSLWKDHKAGKKCGGCGGDCSSCRGCGH